MAEIVFWLSVGVVFYSYLGYPLVLAAIGRPKRNAAEQAEQDGPTVSLVVSVYNEEKGIEEKLRNLEEITAGEGVVELLVGSDGSTDRTVELLRKSRLKGLRVFEFPDRRGKARILNDLLDHARGDIVVFSDANSLFRPDALRNLLRPFSDPGVGAVSGELVLISPGNIGESLYWQYETLVKRLESRAGTLVGATGGVYAARRTLIRRLPVEHAIADDFMIPLRIVEQGYRVTYAPDAVASEIAEETVRGEFRRKVRIGAQNFNALRYVSGMLNPAKGFPAFALWSHKILRWLVPVFLAGFLLAVPALRERGGIYASVFYGELLFIALAIVGFVGERWKIRSPVVVLPYYFLAMNAALCVGLIRSLTGAQSPAWEVHR